VNTINHLKQNCW